MNMNQGPSSYFVSEEAIVPQAVAKSLTTTSTYKSVGAGFWVIGTYNVGTVDSGHVTVQLMQAQDASGTNAKILGSAVTLTTNNHQGMIEASTDSMDLANGFTFAAVEIVTDANVVTAAEISATLSFASPRYETGPNPST